MKFDLNKYTESQITLRFDGNVGDVRQYKDHFREVNLSSPSISSARWSCTWTAPTSAISASTSTS